MSVDKIIVDWKKKTFKPLYWLEGEEEYFIDKVVEYAEHHILNESEASFNLSVFYGKDANWADVLNACRRYPMFAERQVVILKEAQQMKEILKLEGYVNNPLPSTVFVVAHKEGKIDGRSTFAKLLKKKAEVVQTKKLYDNNMPEWIANMVKEKGYSITPGAIRLLQDHIGNDLNRLENEVDKVWINLRDKKSIDEDSIEKYVGISKEYNSFELQAAIAKKDLAKAVRIVQYFGANSKAYPIQLILPSLYAYFSKVYAIFGMVDKSDNALKFVFSNNIYAAKEALLSSKTYGVEGIEKILLLLHEYNLRSIGIRDTGTPHGELMKERVVKMIH